MEVRGEEEEEEELTQLPPAGGRRRNRCWRPALVIPGGTPAPFSAEEEVVDTQDVTKS